MSSTISAEEIADNFNGDDESLRASIKALIELDNAKAVSPIGGHTKSLLSAAYHRLASLTDMKTEIERLESDLGDYRNAADAATARVAALEAQLAERDAALKGK